MILNCFSMVLDTNTAYFMLGLTVPSLELRRSSAHMSLLLDTFLLSLLFATRNFLNKITRSTGVDETGINIR